MRNKNLWIILIAIVIIVAAVYLYVTYGTSLTSPASLSGKNFTLVSYNGSAVEGNYTLSFEEGSAHARFCNTMNGPYTLSNGTISGTLASTLMYCSSPENIMEIESAFGSLLGSGASLTMSGNSLTLSGNGITLVFEQN